MDHEIQQRMLQNQASQIGNLMFTIASQQAHLDLSAEKIAALEAENRELKEGAGAPSAEGE